MKACESLQKARRSLSLQTQSVGSARIRNVMPTPLAITPSHALSELQCSHSYVATCVSAQSKMPTVALPQLIQIL